MTYKQKFLVLLTSFGLAGLAVAQEVARPAERGWVDFKKPILSDPVLQHAKETYILYGCAYCHGVDLKVRNGEAADLLHSGLVGADVEGNILIKLLRAGIPQTAKLSPMPQYSDLSDRELLDISQWIHYSRMEGRYAELMQTKEQPVGDSSAGRAYFDKTCASCHSAADMAKTLSSVKESELKAQVLKPAFLETPPSFSTAQPDVERIAKGRTKHSSLLENYSAADVANLMAYLMTTK